ncbi:MAG: hypothetical protein ACYSWZ_00395 [Planctomycetota bacterium]
MPAICFYIQSAQISQRIVGHPSVSNKPAAKLLYGLEIIIAAFDAQPVTPTLSQILQSLGCRYIRDKCKLAGVQNRFYPIARKLRVVSRSPFAQ